MLARAKQMTVAVAGGQQQTKHNGNAQAKARYMRFSFQQLAERRQFDKIMDILLTENNETLRFWLEFDIRDANHRSGNNGNISISSLHRILAFQPPGCLIETLVLCLADIDKNVPEDVIDFQGMTPLHVAATHACNSDVIRRLSNGSAPGSRVTAPLIRDVWSRYPLHWACVTQRNAGVVGFDSGDKKPIFTKILCQKVSSAATADEFIDAVRILIEAYPEATLTRDVFGMTPLDLAVKFDADRRIVALVDSATRLVRCGRQDFKTGVWDEKESMSLSVTDEEIFPDGFPGEIILHNSIRSSSRGYRYQVWEC